jgi:hypothetical protein
MDEIRFADGTVWGWDDALASRPAATPVEHLGHGTPISFLLTAYRGETLAGYLNPMRLYLNRQRFHTESGRQLFVDFIRERRGIFVRHRFINTALEMYVRLWEEQKILANLALQWRELTDEDVLTFEDFYTEEARTVLNLWPARDRSAEQINQDKEPAREIILRYWNIPQNNPADRWREYITYREQTLQKERADILAEPNHVAMLLFISFLLNDEEMSDDAFYYCIVALTRNHQEISKMVERTQMMLEGSALRWEDHSVLASVDGVDILTPATAIGRIVFPMTDFEKLRELFSRWR